MQTRTKRRCLLCARYAILLVLCVNHRPDEVGPGMDEETEAALDAEPVILENSHPVDENYKYARRRRWPHMTEEAESALGAKMDAEANGKLNEREAKRET